MPPRDPSCPRCGDERPYRKKYCDECRREKLNGQARTYRGSDKGKAAHKHYLITSRYNLTMERYNAMVEGQQGLCLICNKSSELHIDHDHSCCSGITSCGVCVRGLLCAKCNKGLGLFNDDIDVLNNAILYLSRDL